MSKCGWLIFHKMIRQVTDLHSPATAIKISFA